MRNKAQTNYQTSWDLNLLFPNPTDEVLEQEKELFLVETKKFIDKWHKRNDYLSDSKALKEALVEYENWEKKWSNGGKIAYFWLLQAEFIDQNNPEIRAKHRLNEEIVQKALAEIQFFKLKLGKISPEIQKVFLTSQILAPYRHFLETLFVQSQHLLTEKEEKILLLKSTTSHENWVRMTSQFLSVQEREVVDEKGSSQKRNLSQILSLLNSQNKLVRDHAAEKFNEILAVYAPVAEAEINSILTNKKTDDFLRSFSRPDRERHLSDDIESEIVDTLTDCVVKNNDIAHRFYSLKAKLFGVDQLEYHERNVPYGVVEQKYSFDQAINLIYQVLDDLDPQFSQITRSLLRNGQVDVFPKAGKQSGACVVHATIDLPIFVMLNHTDKLQDVLTLIHELGHAINYVLTKDTVSPLYFGTSLATAEVASTFMEDFVLEKLLDESDEEKQLAIVMTKLNDDISTIFRQIACYRFEQELHHEFRQSGYLSKEQIGAIFQKHMENYMGPAVKQPASGQNWWVYWSHIRSFFYVYSYASGLLISKALQKRVKLDYKFMISIKEFLSKGLSASPKTIFKSLGIDITEKSFWISGIDEIKDLLTKTENLAKKLRKID